MTLCKRCKTRPTGHLWLVRGEIYCSPNCERNGKSMFEKLYRQLANDRRSRNG